MSSRGQARGRTPFTYWDYRAGMFHKDMGMRIDLVYASGAFADRVTDAWVDRETRKGTGPSDHAPVIVELTLRPRRAPSGLRSAAGGPTRRSEHPVPGPSRAECLEPLAPT
jgi:hypothetical protein